VKLFNEGAANRIRRFKAGGTSRKTSFQCPRGFRAVKKAGGKGRPKCVPSHIAAGGMGKINKEARKKAKWSIGGAGKMSKMRSARAEKRRGGMKSEDFSPLAMELMMLNEDVSRTNMSERDETINHLSNIFALLSEEFMDETVSDLYEDAMSGVLEMHSAGRLDEDVVDEEGFISSIQPALSLMSKSYEKIENGFDLGNE
jgi:hypothetical protein